MFPAWLYGARETALVASAWAITEEAAADGHRNAQKNRGRGIYVYAVPALRQGCAKAKERRARE